MIMEAFVADIYTTLCFQLYQRTALPLVKYVFDGGKATCFA